MRLRRNATRSRHPGGRSFPFLAALVLVACLLPGVVTPVLATPSVATPDPNAAGTISAGGRMACATMADGHARCWGAGGVPGRAALGDGGAAGSLLPVQVSGITSAVSIAAPEIWGDSFGPGCVRLSDTHVSCWGTDAKGSNGTNSGGSVNAPAALSGGGGYSSMDTTLGFGCAVEAGKVACWGDNTYGQLGLGAEDSSAHPVPAYVPGITTAEAVDVGGQFACAILANTTVTCWGANWYGQLGDGTTTSSASPVAVQGVTGAVQISAGGSYGTACAVIDDGTIACWGSDVYGKLGDGPEPSAPVGTVVQVSGISTAVQVSVGGSNACALLQAGTVQCWGYGASGALGNGTYGVLPTYNAEVPVAVADLTGVNSISVGMDFACAVVLGGAADCWGDNTYGQLGNGTKTTSNIPVPVVMGQDTTAPTVTKAPWVIPQTRWQLTSGALASTVRLEVHWTGADTAGPGSGIDHFRLDRTTDGGSTWRTLASAIADGGADTMYVAVAPSTGTVRFRVTAYDHAGNASTSTAGPSMTVRVNQQGVAAAVYRGTWTTKTVSGDSGGTDKRTSAKGASVTYTFSGRAFALVTSSSASTGDVDVYVDGKLQPTPLVTTTGIGKPRWVVWSRRWTSVGTHVIRLVNRATATRPVLAVDAFVVVR